MLLPGVAYPLIKRLLGLNKDDFQMIEVVLFSRNDPDTGLRVFNSIEHYGLPISRAVFVAGKNPFNYLNSFNASLFLSGNKQDVREAINHGLPAGYVEDTEYKDNDEDDELRIAFDFDGVLADDSSERIYKDGGIRPFQLHEIKHAHQTMPEGPLYSFLKGISKFQKKELEKKEENKDYHPTVRIAVCTARNAPAHKRVVHTLRQWDIRVDEAFFLGGVNKARVLEVYRPHIFFDDQIGHIEGISEQFPSVHVPYGVANVKK